MARPIKIDIKEANDGQWYTSIVAGNGEVWSSSETYTRKASAIKSALRFRQAMRGEVVIRLARDGQRGVVEAKMDTMNIEATP